MPRRNLEGRGGGSSAPRDVGIWHVTATSRGHRGARPTLSLPPTPWHPSPKEGRWALGAIGVPVQWLRRALFSLRTRRALRAGPSL